MKLEGTQQLQAPRERVFQCLTDPEVLRRCMPGCERLEQIGENVFSATIRTGVGSIKGIFNGSVRLEDIRFPEHYRLVVEGKGTPGFLKGSGDLDLESVNATTVVHYTGEVQIGGTIASVGQRMLQATSRMMLTQFFTSLEVEAQSRADEPPPKHGFFRTTLRWFSGWLRRMFRRS